MVREILEWCDKKQDESLECDSEVILLAKSCGLGAIEGAIEGFSILGAIITVTGIIKLVKRN